MHDASPTFDAYVRDLVRVFTAADPDFKILVYFHACDKHKRRLSSRLFGQLITAAFLAKHKWRYAQVYQWRKQRLR